MPSCNLGDTQLADACPPEYTCYSRTLCGTTIYCISEVLDLDAGAPRDGGSCDPALEPDRQYVGTSPAECSVILFACPVNTNYFGNACGCGCEQDASCPEWVDCMPPATDPLCTTEGRAKCPYTRVAY
jgi:hypothetical protein